MNTKRRLAIRTVSAIVAGIVVLLTIKITYAFARYARVERQFAAIKPGDSRESVVKKLGKPNYYSGPCGVIHVPRADCALEYVYSHPFAPLIPEYYIVTFSGDDRVTEAQQWESP